MLKLNSALKKFLPILALVAVALYQYFDGSLPDREPVAESTREQDVASDAWKAGEWIAVRGTVERVLSDDNEGSRHQRFIIRIPDRTTLLVAHNIDLANRVPLSRGDTVEIRGRYEPNARGGVIHWTHHDPGNKSARAGWIEHEGQRYR